MIPRLGAASLDRLPAWVQRPGYDRNAIERGVVHLGVGAFHRAHQAVLFDDLLRVGDRRWGVVGASLRSTAVPDAMNPQDGLYSVCIGEDVRVIGAVGAVFGRSDALVAAIAGPQTRLVTITVTEKGYIPQGEGLNMAGCLAAGLALRRGRGLPGLTLISCDNLSDNGTRLRDAVLAVSDPALAEWIAGTCTFPQSMVDRIVPATDTTDIEALAARVGVVDRAMVKTEPFFQWVIEDRFAGERPEFEAAGAQVTHDIAAWEQAKLRLLNGAHSGIAYLGGLAGFHHVDEFVAWPAGRRFVEAMWDETQTTFVPPSGLNLTAYRVALMARFNNASLQHRTRQIAMDGSQKLPPRLLAPIAVRLERGQGIGALALAVAAWMRWQGGRTDTGEAFAIDDPLASEMAARRRGVDDGADQVRALLSIDAIFPPTLAAEPGFVDALTRHFERLARQGARAALEDESWT